MNINNLYPTDTQVPVGSTAGQYIDKLTARIPSLSPLSQESYWLGYISYDNLPLVMQHSKLYYSDEDTVVIENDTVVDNYPCGYIDGVIRGAIYMEDDVYITNHFLQYIRFLNDLHPEYSAAYLNANTSPINATSIFFLYYLTIGGEVVAKDILSSMPAFSINFNNSENDGLVGMMEFMQGQRTITITLGQLTFDITIEDDLYETGHAQIVSNEDPDSVIDLFINTMNLPDRGYINGNIGYAAYNAFAAKVKYEDEDEIHSYNVSLAVIENMLRPLILYVKYMYGLVTNFTYSDEGTTHALFYSTGAAGEFSATELDSLDAATGYIYSGNLIAYSAYGSGGINKRTYLAMVMPGKDLYKIFSLYMPRVDVSSNATRVQASYINNVTYATDVSSTNEFLARLKTGDIGDQTFKDDLRPWQYSSIAENDFLEDDVPPYEPEPEPEDGEESGDPINIQIRAIRGATNFITQYAMTSTQVAAFGNKLWTSWIDGQGDLTDFFQNFWLVATGQTDTGSMDIGAMMQFIVSLQVFPFVIPQTFGTLVDEIKVGRGVSPIDMQEAPNVLRLSTSNIYLGCGSRQIPRPYGDYRDYTNITITAYLPFVGTCELNAADVIGRTLTCHYFIDLYTGGCTAYMVAFDDEGHNYPVCQMDGSIGATLPVSATNSAQIKTQTISNAMGLASTLAGSYSQHINAGKQAIAGLVSGNGEALAMAAESQFGSKLSALQGVGNFAENVLTQAGVGCPSLAGGKGDLSSFSQPAYPYIQMRYGLYDEPSNYNHSVGVPSTKSGTLSGYSGFVVCENVDVSSLTCHTDEKAAIKAALESGVYV